VSLAIAISATAREGFREVNLSPPVKINTITLVFCTPRHRTCMSYCIVLTYKTDHYCGGGDNKLTMKKERKKIIIKYKTHFATVSSNWVVSLRHASTHSLGTRSTRVQHIIRFIGSNSKLI